jgi:DNA-binding MarR family transcriptional regulator
MKLKPPFRAPRQARRASASALIRRLAWFRYSLRQFLRFSEHAARECGLTPQQHQLMLGIAGYTGREWATIGELAEFLQERHNAVVGLVERAEKKGLVRKVQSASDRRFVRVHLTAKGESVLAQLSHLHRQEAARLSARLPGLGPKIPSGTVEAFRWRMKPLPRSL